jgi:acetyl esterase/lipase
MLTGTLTRIAGLTGLLAVLQANAQPGDVWTIGERTLPPPVHASQQLAGAIARAPQPGLSDSSRYPQTDAGWIEMQQAARNESSTLPSLEAALDLTIEQSEIAGVTVYAITPQEVAGEHRNHIFLHLHGGGYVLGGGPGAAGEAARISASAGIRAVSVDYRMPPESPFPAAVDDTIAVYRVLLEDHNAGEVAIGGTSAGAGLALAALLQMKNLDLPLPGAVFAGTPWADLTDTSDSLHSNKGIDRILVTYDGLLRIGGELYSDGNDLTNPLISPLYGDFASFPPTILISGTRDMLLSDTVRTHRKLLAAGVEADLHVFEGMSHAEYMIMPEIPEGQATLTEISAFFKDHLD